MADTYDNLRRRLHQALLHDLESHEVGGERLRFDRDTGRQWFRENEGEPVFLHLKATLEQCLRTLNEEGPSPDGLLIEVASLRLECLGNMHASKEPGAIFAEEFQLSPWYRTTKQAMDPAGYLSDREFADVNVHLLLQEACYMLELPGFLEPGSAPETENAPQASPESVEGRLAAVEASNRRLRIVAVLALVGIVALVGVAFGTANHWTKVDVPEHPTTFHRKNSQDRRVHRHRRRPQPLLGRSELERLHRRDVQGVQRRVHRRR